MNYPWTISASISSYNQLTSTNQTQTYSKSDHSASDTLKLCGNISNGSPSPHRSELVPCLSAIFGPDFSMFQRIEDTARLEKCRGWTIRLCLDQSSHEHAHDLRTPKLSQSAACLDLVFLGFSGWCAWALTGQQSDGTRLPCGCTPGGGQPHVATPKNDPHVVASSSQVSSHLHTEG